MRHWIKWIVLFLVRPLLVMWLIIEGAPNVIRSIGQAVATVVKAFK